jgi:Tol biopolymer transport system component
VADAHQFGPVGYRDPAGAVAPDGRSIAYSEGRFLRVRPIGGGPAVDLPAGESQIRNLIWSPDSRYVIADGDRIQGAPVLYDIVERTRQPLWAGRGTLRAQLENTSAATTAKTTDFRQLAWSPAGRFIAAVVNAKEGQELWTLGVEGAEAVARKVEGRIVSLAWTPRGDIACVSTVSGKSRLTIPCGGAPVVTTPELELYGPIAFAADRDAVYASAANRSGTVDLWSFAPGGGRATKLTSFSRDTYAPSLSRDGAVVFKVQNYRTVVAAVDAVGGPTRPLASFQSETPSWHPTGRWLGVTYGTWRRVPDDAKYPDIAQDAGIIEVQGDRAIADRVATVVHASESEDQSLCWSPNARWIAFHSHKDQSDDIWLRASDGSQADAKRISFLGRGAETGWPRWSSDGRSILFSGARRDTGRPALFVAGVDQETGSVTAAPQPIDIARLDGDVGHAEWLPDSAHIVADVKEGPGRHAIVVMTRAGGELRVVHRYVSEHDTPGIAISPDGRAVAFIAPAPDGFFQVFTMPLAGGTPSQITHDPSHKTQPAWSPDGARVAFTVWSYDAQFWRLE